MAKELFISSSPHETKVAVLEDDQLVEVYYERESDVGLVGSIYKGRVSRVLPGMQSAFVNIGLERDAFLYVSDFVEDEEEYDKIFTEAEARATRFVQSPQAVAEPAVSYPSPGEQASAQAIESPSPPPGAERTEGDESPAPPVSAAMLSSSGPPQERGEYRRHEQPRGRRRRRRGGRDFRSGPKSEPRERPAEHTEHPTPHSFEILPGESLAKYRDVAPEAPAGEDLPGETPTSETPEPSAPVESQTMAASAVPVSLPPEQPAPVTATTGEPGEASLDSTRPPEPEIEPEEEAIAFPGGIAMIAPLPTPDRPEPVAAERPLATPAPEPSSAPSGTLEESTETEETPVRRPWNLQEPRPELPEARKEPAAALEGVEAESELEPPPLDPAAEEFVEETYVERTSAAPGEGAATESKETDQSAAAPSEMTSLAPPPAEPEEKKYTLREPYQRPRFAPRRRRGHRGMGRSRAPRYESPRPGNNTPIQISDLLKEGQEILVQIAKEPLGTKGARITSHIALPGRYLVFMPTIDHIGVSRKISSEEERLRLRNIILENKGALTGGFIVRTAGAGRSEEELKTDLKFLSTLWSDIRAKAERVKAPALLHRDLDLVQRILRDTLSPDFKQVRVDNEIEYERCVEFVNRCQPSLVGHVKLYTRNTPLFEEFGIQQEVDKALKPKVWLKSGGYIVINQTEALVAIDVNTGKYVGKTNRLEDTIVKTNIDAINEIVRQIRLRDLGGIIVIDFIDMDERRNRQKVVQALEEALRRDRAPTKVLSFNDFGLVAITRKRVKQSLERTLCQPCVYCAGSGWIKSVNTVCNEILGEVRKMARELEGDSITLRVNPDVAHALKSRQGALLSELESLTHKDIIIKSDPTVHQERFEIY
jgi:ribonuclease G